MTTRETTRVLWMLLRIALLAWGIAVFAAWVFQSRLIWIPSGAPRLTPATLKLAFRDVTLRTQDGEQLHAWLLPATAPRATVVFCHGNGGSIEHRLGAARALLALDVNVLLFDYRGYGGSSGSPSEEGTYLDAESAWEFAATLAGDSGSVVPIVAWGESLGGAVALELARRRPVAALVTESAFSSLGDVAAHHYWWMPARLVLRSKYDNVGKAAANEPKLPPWLLFHSRDDHLVPFEHAEALVAAAKGDATLVATSGGHNDGGFLLDPASIAAVRAFFDRTLASR